MVIWLSNVTSGTISLVSAGIEIVLLEEGLPASDLLRPGLLHQCGRIALGHEGRTQRLEGRIAEMVVAVEMAVDHPTDRLVGDLADAIDQVLAVAGMLAGVDHQHALVGHEHDRVGRVEIVEEIEIGRDLLELDLALGLGDHRGGEKKSGRHRGDEAPDRIAILCIHSFLPTAPIIAKNDARRAPAPLPRRKSGLPDLRRGREQALTHPSLAPMRSGRGSCPMPCRPS